MPAVPDPDCRKRAMATMHVRNALLVGLATATLAGCAGSSTEVGQSASPRTHASSGTAAAQSDTSTTSLQVGARAFAQQFYRLYLADRFAATWEMLAPAAKSHVPRHLWIQVHDRCRPASGGKHTFAIKSVTVFGDSAIVAVKFVGPNSRQQPSRDVFSYTKGQWRYSPGDLGVYEHGSVHADIVAARAAGFCTSLRSF